MEVDDFVNLTSPVVRSETGDLVGEIAAVHVDEGTDRVRFVEIAQAQHELHFIVPTAGASVTNDALIVPYATELVEQGPLVEADKTLSVGEINIVVVYYGTNQAGFHGPPITARSSATVEPVTAQKKPFIRKTLPPPLPNALTETEGMS